MNSVNNMTRDLKITHPLRLRHFNNFIDSNGIGIYRRVHSTLVISIAENKGMAWSQLLESTSNLCKKARTLHFRAIHRKI